MTQATWWVGSSAKIPGFPLIHPLLVFVPVPQSYCSPGRCVESAHTICVGNSCVAVSDRKEKP